MTTFPNITEAEIINKLLDARRIIKAQDELIEYLTKELMVKNNGKDSAL